jgi:hypothetical protein
MGFVSLPLQFTTNAHTQLFQTAVASLVAGNTLGVARKATIVPVRIADKASCKKVTTTTDDVTAGINWAITDFKARCSAKAGIINISWEIYQTPASEKAFTDVSPISLSIFFVLRSVA